MSRRALLVAAFVAVPSLASAGASRAWTAAKKVHPQAPVIMGVDVASARSTEAFKTLFPKLVAKKPEVKDVLDKLQTTCSFDPFTAISSIVAVVDEEKDTGAFYIALTGGWTTAKLADCGKKVAQADGKTLTVKAGKKNIQELSLTGKDEKLYLGTIGKDVLVVATHPTDEAAVKSVMSAKGGGDTSKLAAKLDTSATVWMATTQKRDIQPGVSLMAVYGTVRIATGTVNVDGHAVMSDAKQATELADQANRELPKAQASMPPMVKNMLKDLKVNAAGPEVQVTASAPEKDVLMLLNMVAPL